MKPRILGKSKPVPDTPSPSVSTPSSTIPSPPPQSIQCPICNIPMSSLIKLNNHIDSQHLNQRQSIPRNHYIKSNKCHKCNNSSITNCCICGLTFCSNHINRGKVNSLLEFDKNGIWCDCCIDCINKSPNIISPINNLTDEFKELRNKRLIDESLKNLLLDRRLDKVFNWMLNNVINEESFINFEKSLVNWNNQGNCQCCLNTFTWLNRRHHCRICGESVCGDLQKGCSMIVPLGMLFELLIVDKDISIQERDRIRNLLKKDKFGLRICKECKRRVLNKKVFLLDKQQFDDEMVKFFNIWKLISKKLESEDLSFIKDDLENKLYVNYFNKLDKLIKDIDLFINKGNCKNDEIRILTNLKNVIIKFIKINLPILRKSQNVKLEKERQKLQNIINDRPKLSKRELREKRDKLIVLNEQKFLVTEMYETFKKQRRFDDLKTLDINLEDIEKEINQLNLELGDETFTI